MNVLLKFPKGYFKEDFLDIEVKKELGIRGDDLPNYIRPGKGKPVNILHTQSPDSILFNHNIIYLCKAVENEVVLVGVPV